LLTPLIARASTHRYGDCDGNARDANFVNVEDHEGNKKLFGSIAVGSDVCQISTTVGGGSSIICSKPIKKDLTHEIPEGVVPPLVGDDDGERKLQFGFAPSPNSVRGQRDSRRLFDDSGSTIDIMVVWSKAAECGTSSLLSPCTFTAQTELAILGKINLALAYTNTAFAESQISTQLRLVHAYQHPSYVEPLTGWRDYDALVGMADDGVKAKRALYGADMVAFIIGTLFVCSCRSISLCLMTHNNSELQKVLQVHAAAWPGHLIGPPLPDTTRIKCTLLLVTGAFFGQLMMCCRTKSRTTLARIMVKFLCHCV
jgi:hypothetical protein